MSKKKRYVVVGLGNFGASAAEVLYRAGQEVIAVDIDQDKIDKLAAVVTRAAVGSGSDAALLRQVGAASADHGIVSTGSDITASVLSSMTLFDLDITHVTAKVISEEHDRVMKQIGVHSTVFPERDSARNLGRSLLDESILEFHELGRGFGLQEMLSPIEWRGQSLRELRLRERYNISVVGIHKNSDDTFHIPPDPDQPLHEEDTLIIAGSEGALQRASEFPTVHEQRGAAARKV